MLRELSVAVAQMLLCLVVLFGPPASVSALTLDFEMDAMGNAIAHGDVIDTQYADLGVVIAIDNPNRTFDLGVAFDTTRGGTADPDLESPWSSGNLAPDTFLGNVLIITQSRDEANDEGNRPAGTISFMLDSAARALGFDLVDVDSPMEEAGGLDLFSGGSLVASIEFADLIDPASGAFDASVAFGDNSANRIQPIDPGALFDRAVFRVGGSMAIDNVQVVSEPAAAVLLGLVLFSLAGVRRRP